jgi:mono/diheme cytochrome c family protein
MRRACGFLLLTAGCLLPAGCRIDMQDQPRYEAYEAGDEKYFKDGKSSRQLIEGTVPRVAPGQPYVDVQSDYLYTGRPTAAGSAVQGAPGAGGAQGAQGVRANVQTAGGATQAGEQSGPDVFPMAIDEAALRRGQERYNIYCAMCHGMTGEGDGMIWRRGFRKPPSFYEDRLQSPTSSASHFFDVVTNGWGAMPSYSDMIPAEDRWKIIAYVRALQLSGKGKLEDVPADKRPALEAGQQPATRGVMQGEGGEGQSGQGDRNH